MPRKSIADRLQAGFEVVPLENAETQARRAAFEARPGVRRLRKWTAIILAVFLVLLGIWLAVVGIVWNNWWNTKTSLVCTIDDMDHYGVYGKVGYDHTVYDVYTTTCGDLEVTQGAGKNDREAIAFAKSLQIGSTYEMDVRGWDGWMGESRAIAGARLIGGGQ
ncbi:hypothetical protein ACRAWC_01525 [Leifsonia sp. L25]|uniref:hypothetical protein n=1 Tax=Actinomycetes TaxID=1760 RepID=UPI003D68B5C8